jgi:hypothetical protein
MHSVYVPGNTSDRRVVMYVPLFDDEFDDR